MPEPRDYTVESVRRAVRALKAIAESDEGISLADLSRALDLNKATLFRLLTTMMADDLVDQEEVSKRYRLGVGLISLGQRAQGTLDLVALARPGMEDLATRFGVVVYLNVPTKENVLTIERLPRLAGMQFVRAGMTMPLHACASGLVFLAFDESNLLDDVIGRGLTRYASGTIGTVARLRREVKLVRERGYASDENSLDEGVRSVAVPIFDASKRVMAAIGMTAVSAAHDERTWERVRDEGQRVAHSVSLRLAGRAHPRAEIASAGS